MTENSNQNSKNSPLNSDKFNKKIQKANSHQSFPDLEIEILKYWQEHEILKKSIENRPVENQKTFYDGPITANGMPHHGHMLTFAIKDLFPRYWTMKGFRVTRSLGWDCQGIPVEYEIEKKLGFKEKKDIEKYGVAAFNQLCRESVQQYKGAMVELEEKMGRLTDKTEEYSTMDADYIESIWWSFGELYKKDLLYEGFKVVPYSTRAGTSLSNAEVSLGGYKKFVDKAVTVKFELVKKPGTFVLAWTTTPWTLPTNFGLAIGSGIDYISILDKKVGENYILAKNCLEKIFPNANQDTENFEITEIHYGDIIGLEYKPLFDYFLGRENCFKIENGFHVTDQDGTGVVHLAPYGKEDCEIFHSIGIEAIDVLDSQGDFLGEFVPDLEGVNYRDGSLVIIEKLKEKKLLFKVENYTHEMPICWRTNTPLIYKPITSWYIAMSKLRSELLENNENVNWIPGHIKHGRMGNWLGEIKDWGISRLRYWGTPLPIWKSESGKIIVISSYQQLFDLSGVMVTDPHRPFIDGVVFEKDGQKYTRISDVIDVWYDSGAMPFARFHYPFENKELFESKFPAEFVAEGIDQTRGWFYSLIAISTAIFGKSPYKNVVINGFTLDDKGYKVSKSKKNYTAPDKLFQLFGADTIRLNYFNTPIVAGEDASITEKTLKRTMQEITLPLWNIHVYLTTYCDLNNIIPDPNFSISDLQGRFSLTLLDKWVVSRVNETVENATNNLDQYFIQKAMVSITDLMDDISKWYIRRSRDRFAAGDQVSINVLYYCVLELSKLLAPFTPFLAEKIYQDLTLSNNSIHLTDFPVCNPKITSDFGWVLEKMSIVRSISSIGLKARMTAGIKVRQPLQNIIIYTPSALENWQIEILEQELNVLSVNNILSKSPESTNQAVNSLHRNYIIVEEKLITLALNTKISPELQLEGKIKDLIRTIQSERKNAGLKMGQAAKLTIVGKYVDFLEKIILENIARIQGDTFLSGIEFDKSDNLMDEIGKKSEKLQLFESSFTIKFN